MRIYRNRLIINIDGLIQIIGVPSIAKYEEDLFMNDSPYEEVNEAVNKYIDAVYSVSESLFNEHGLTLSSLPNNNYEKIVSPLKSWKVAANKIITTINGYGMFRFNSLNEFLDSGPYTPREACRKHFGWMKHWYEIYGENSGSSRVFRLL